MAEAMPATAIPSSSSRTAPSEPKPAPSEPAQAEPLPHPGREEVTLRDNVKFGKPLTITDDEFK
eukprot:7930520-Heterocapsa_arctica.AAC.1